MGYIRQHSGVVHSQGEGLNAYSTENKSLRSRVCISDLTPPHQALSLGSENRRTWLMGNNYQAIQQSAFLVSFM